MLRKILIGVAILAVALLVAVAVLLGPFYSRVQRFAADPRAGFHSDFYLYVSPKARAAAAAGSAITLLVQPNNSGTNSDDVSVHRKDAWWTTYGRSKVADELGVALLVPAFPRPATDWRTYTHALDRDVLTTKRADLARLDLQLIAMLDVARAAMQREGLRSEEKILLQGFSASGMFANRFAALHPRRVKAVAAGSPGGWPIAPLAAWKGEPLPYPAGVADLEQLTGTPFDAIAYRRVPQLLVMGSLDDNDSLDFGDGWDAAAAKQVDRLFGADPQARWANARVAYRAGGANAEFRLVPGVGHARKELQPLSNAFFARVLRGGSQ